MPTVDKIVDYVILVFVANQIVKDDDFLVVRGQLLERDDVVPAPGRLDDPVVVQKGLLLVLVEVLRVQEDFVELQQLVKHVEKDVRFAGVAGAADEHSENVCGHGGVPPPIAAGDGGQNGIVVGNFHHIYILSERHVDEEAAPACAGSGRA